MGNGVSSGMEIFAEGELEAEMQRLGGSGDSSVKKLLGKGYRDVVQLIIRPKRAEYSLQALGPSTLRLAELKPAGSNKELNPAATNEDDEFRVVRRRDFDVLNDRKLRVVCSHWQLYEDADSAAPLATPCLVYLHSNIGSRVDALNMRDLALRRGFSVLALDFCGSGLSDGVYVTMGWNEARDLNAVLQELENDPAVTEFAIYAHSMGTFPAVVNVAARSLVADKKLLAKMETLPHELRPANANVLAKPIKALVFDGGYATMAQVNEGLLRAMQEEGFPVPKSVMKLAMAAIQKSAKKRAEVDLDLLRPIDFVGACSIPALFIAGDNDRYVLPQQSEELVSKYPGPASLLPVKGEHYTPRDPAVYAQAVDFLYSGCHSRSLH